MKTGDAVWAVGPGWREGEQGEVLEMVTPAVARVRWATGEEKTAWIHDLRTTPPPTSVEAKLREQIAALQTEVRRAKGNVRDACATACAEVEARYHADRFGTGSAERALGAQECAEAIAALDLEVL